MRCSECEALRQKYRSATRNFGASIRMPNSIVHLTAAVSEFGRARVNIPSGFVSDRLRLCIKRMRHGHDHNIAVDAYLELLNYSDVYSVRFNDTRLNCPLSLLPLLLAGSTGAVAWRNKV